MFHDGGQSGRLRLSAGDGEAVIYFEAGDILRLDISGITSADGPYDIFRWRDGEFEFDLGAEIPPGNFSIDIEEFILKGGDYERRWFVFARNPVENMTYIHPTGRASGDVSVDATQAYRALGEGRSLLSFSQRLGVGLLQAAEWAEELRAAGRVVFESPEAFRAAAAVQDLWEAVFRLYRVFAGKVLASHLEQVFREYCERNGLPVSLEGETLQVAPLFEGGDAVERWRAANAFLLAEMSGPVGKEAARLLWEQARSSLEPAAAGVVDSYVLAPAPQER